jgi:hypothetical protein
MALFARKRLKVKASEWTPVLQYSAPKSCICLPKPAWCHELDNAHLEIDQNVHRPKWNIELFAKASAGFAEEHEIPQQHCSTHAVAEKEKKSARWVFPAPQL